MYDVEQLKAALPYCKKLEFESHSDPQNDTRKVIVIAYGVDGTDARIECPDMPPDTLVLVLVVHAAFHQALHPFVNRLSLKMQSGATTLAERGAPAPVLLPIDKGGLPGLMPLDDLHEAVEATTSEVLECIDTEGTEVNEKRKPKRLPPKSPTLDKDKLDEAASELDRALATGRDDG